MAHHPLVVDVIPTKETAGGLVAAKAEHAGLFIDQAAVARRLGFQEVGKHAAQLASCRVVGYVGNEQGTDGLGHRSAEVGIVTVGHQDDAFVEDPHDTRDHCWIRVVGERAGEMFGAIGGRA